MASAHIITAVIGSGVLSLGWAIAQLGWIAGPSVMLLFSCVIYCTSTLLADCYRSGDPLSGKRNYTYMDAVRANLANFVCGAGGGKVKICGIIHSLNLFGVAIGYTIASSISMIQTVYMRAEARSRVRLQDTVHDGIRNCSNPLLPNSQL